MNSLNVLKKPAFSIVRAFVCTQEKDDGEKRLMWNAELWHLREAIEIGLVCD